MHKYNYFSNDIEVKSINQPQNISINGFDFEPYIEMSTLTTAFNKIARKINMDYKNSETPPVLLITLRGAMAFAAEISKRLNFMVEWEFIKCSSYGGNLHSSGDIRFDLEPTINLNDRHVIVIEDIVDSGHTWAAINDYFVDSDLASLSIATMFFKADAYLYPDLNLDYVGIEIENKFVIGYGLDYNGLGRNLNGIYILKS